MDLYNVCKEAECLERKANYQEEKTDLVVLFKGDNAARLGGGTKTNSVLLHTPLNPNSLSIVFISSLLKNFQLISCFFQNLQKNVKKKSEKNGKQLFSFF